jgi:hypothetical protein
MPDSKPTDQLPKKDLLITRPDPEPLPTRLEPDSPEARGAPADPKPVPMRRQNDTDEKNSSPAADDRPV